MLLRRLAGVLLLVGCAQGAPAAEMPAPRREHAAAKRVAGDRESVREMLRGLAAPEGFNGPAPPLVHASYKFDLGALPLLGEPAPLEGADRVLTHVVLARGTLNPQGFGIAGGFIGVLDVGNERAVQPLELPPPTLRSGHFAGLPPNGVHCVTIAPKRDAAATVQGFRTSSWSRSELTFFELSGKIDSWTCLGRMERAARVRARAVLPGLLYAFRERAPDGKESLALIGPQSDWFATSEDREPSDRKRAMWGSFTRLDLPIERGSAGSALMNLTTFSLRNALDARGSRNGPAVDKIGYSGDPMITLSVEVVWPSNAEAPEATAFAASYHPEAEKIFDLLELDPAGIR